MSIVNRRKILFEYSLKRLIQRLPGQLKEDLNYLKILMNKKRYLLSRFFSIK